MEAPTTPNFSLYLMGLPIAIVFGGGFVKDIAWKPFVPAGGLKRPKPVR